jgi:hypothetical protein
MSEYKCMAGMIDNRKVHDTHQEAIKRVLQRKHENIKVSGHQGKMGHAHRSDAPFKRPAGESLTPRKA